MPTKKSQQQTVENPTPQPTAPETVAPAGGQAPVQQVQYIVVQQSLKGLGGWLTFFLVCFGLASIVCTTLFFASMLALPAASAIVTLIFAPILAAGYIASIVLISLQKKLGKIFALITLGISGVYSVLALIVPYMVDNTKTGAYLCSEHSSRVCYWRSEDTLPLLVSGIMVAIIVHVLIALYFIISRRVKETLVD